MTTKNILLYTCIISAFISCKSEDVKIYPELTGNYVGTCVTINRDQDDMLIETIDTTVFPATISLTTTEESTLKFGECEFPYSEIFKDTVECWTGSSLIFRTNYQFYPKERKIITVDYTTLYPLNKTTTCIYFKE